MRFCDLGIGLIDRHGGFSMSTIDPAEQLKRDASCFQADHGAVL